MKNVCILVPEHVVIQAVADPHYLFNTVNQFLIASGKNPLFNVELVGLKKKVVLNDKHFVIQMNRQIKEVEKTDLIFIPALSGNMQDALKANKKLIPWIKKQYSNGAEIASLCLGAFLLASTGLLNGKLCSTHWSFTNEFRSMFPEVQLADGSIITEDKGIYSSGGANSYWNLLLHLIEKYTDRETTILASKYFAIDIDRNNQSSFAIFKGQKEHNDTAIKKAQEYIENNITQKISIEELADKVAVGRRSFERRFRQATNNSVLEYIQRVKIEVVKRKFETTRQQINEVMFEVGYTDSKAFRTLFKKITGLTPIEYRNKYNKMTDEKLVTIIA
jgi:transcriptional regulator GlxA family with amidase domain